MEREKILEGLKGDPSVDVLVVGGGINGIGVVRDLALQGVRVLLAERGDFCKLCQVNANHVFLHDADVVGVALHYSTHWLWVDHVSLTVTASNDQANTIAHIFKAVQIFLRFIRFHVAPSRTDTTWWWSRHKS